RLLAAARVVRLGQLVLRPVHRPVDAHRPAGPGDDLARLVVRRDVAEPAVRFELEQPDAVVVAAGGDVRSVVDGDDGQRDDLPAALLERDRLDRPDPRPAFQGRLRAAGYEP